MSKHDYPYKRSVNVTAWVLQIIVCIILLGSSAWLLFIVESDDYDTVIAKYEGLLTAAAGLQIALTALTIVLDIVEIVLIARQSMPPQLIWRRRVSTSLSQLIYSARLVHAKRKGTLTAGRYAPAHIQDMPARNVHSDIETGYGGSAVPPVQAYNAGYYGAPDAGLGNAGYKPSASPEPPQYGSGYGQGHGHNSYELDNRH
ncbi:Uu.00g031300.m01.CDS01 [Anthostomella pinea]|uniref:Uu.00g031300.m01.CDS01 n=1 Tax=Anthostomella pinea TaxID=933095 RepID=A0AAI8V924_9PEZI|nr:Uu.00g031300.m01.CDS01 [Anthostomella pinea]